jgi:hypothetical protein
MIRNVIAKTKATVTTTRVGEVILGAGQVVTVEQKDAGTEGQITRAIGDSGEIIPISGSSPTKAKRFLLNKKTFDEIDSFSRQHHGDVDKLYLNLPSSRIAGTNGTNPAEVTWNKNSEGNRVWTQDCRNSHYFCTNLFNYI